jgi:hypothetical protein
VNSVLARKRQPCACCMRSIESSRAVSSHPAPAPGRLQPRPPVSRSGHSGQRFKIADLRTVCFLFR